MIANSTPRRGGGRAAFSMLMLYAGKTSGIIVNLVFLPIYSLELGPEGFGIVAVILSLQALLMMLDLGMSTVVGRDIAANESSPSELLRQVFSAELGLVFFYGALMLVVGVLSLAGVRFGIGPFSAFALVAMFMLLVLQNLHYSAIIARRAYAAASGLQVVGNLVRAGGTAFILTYVSPTLTAFIASQLAGAVLQVIASRHLCIREFTNDPRYQVLITIDGLRQSVLVLLRRARPLMLLSVAGAAVTQLDKPIISFFMSPSSVAPYFLAMTFSTFPSAILAAPVVQYFQPKLIQAIALGDDANSELMVKRFTIVLILLVVIPCLLIWQWSESIIGLWLHDSALSIIVTQYAKVLLPAFALGSVFFVPVVLLLAVQDFRYQAITSVAMTVTTLILVAYCASIDRIDLVTIVYFIYFAMASTSVWGRSLFLQKTRIFALIYARKFVSMCAFILLVSLCFMSVW